MRIIGTIVVALALLSPVPAQAHDGSENPCVNNHEYRHVRGGGHYKNDVHRLFDSNGRRIHRSRDIMVRQYRICPHTGHTAAQVFYVQMDNGRWLSYDTRRF